MLRPDEDYVGKFERWALTTGLIAFVAPWLVLVSDTANGYFAWAAGIVLLVWALGATVGVAFRIEGHQVGRTGRIGTAIIVGDVLGALLFFVSFVATVLVLYQVEPPNG